MHAREPCAAGDIREADRIGEMGIDKFDRAIEPPRGQGAGLALLPVGQREVPCNQARHDGEADAIGEHLAHRRVLRLRYRERLSEPFQRGVAHELGIVDTNIACMRPPEHVLEAFAQDLLPDERCSTSAGDSNTALQRTSGAVICTAPAATRPRTSVLPA